MPPYCKEQLIEELYYGCYGKSTVELDLNIDDVVFVVLPVVVPIVSKMDMSNPGLKPYVCEDSPTWVVVADVPPLT